MTPEARIAQAEAENARQCEQIAALMERVRRLEARLAKDSHNSSRSPTARPSFLRRDARPSLLATKRSLRAVLPLIPHLTAASDDADGSNNRLRATSSNGSTSTRRLSSPF
jgi:hypothetical protein